MVKSTIAFNSNHLTAYLSNSQHTCTQLLPIAKGSHQCAQHTADCKETHSIPLKLSYVSQALGTGSEHQFLNHFIHGLLPHDSVHFCLLASALHDPHLEQVLIVGVPQGPQAHPGCGEAPTLGVQVQRHQPLCKQGESA